MATNATPDVRSSRPSRLNLGASARQEQLIKAAAAATDKTMTDFVLEARRSRPRRSWPTVGSSS